MSSVWNIPAVATGTRRKLQHCGSHAGPLRLCTRIAWKIQARRSGSRQNLEDVRKQPPGWLIFSTTAAVPGRGADLDVCVASSTAAAARGDAAHAAFDRKTSLRSKGNQDPRVQGIVYRPLVWTADAPPYPTVTRTICNVQRTQRLVETGSRCRQKLSNVDGSMTYKLSCFGEGQQ